jgi:predicted nucleic acid-binding protein
VRVIALSSPAAIPSLQGLRQLRLPLTTFVKPARLIHIDRPLALAAAMVKGAYALSFADCLVVALAQRLGATVLIGDPEFHPVAALVAVDWLPRRGSGRVL